MTLPPGQFATIERGHDGADRLGAGGAAMTITTTRRARLVDVELPDFGMPGAGTAPAPVDLRRSAGASP